MSGTFLSFIVATCFAGYAFFDCLTLLIRVAASQLGQNAAGGAFEKIMSTFKRLAMFMYPPILGVIIVRKDVETLLIAILMSFGAGSVVVVLCILFRMRLLHTCSQIVDEFKLGRNAGSSILRGAVKRLPMAAVVPAKPAFIYSLHKAVANDLQLFVAAAWVVLVYSSSIFIMNALAMKFSDSALILLQTLGLVNGLGTVLLAFVVDPLIARYLDKAAHLKMLVLNVLCAQLAIYLVIAPALFVIMFSVLF